MRSDEGKIILRQKVFFILTQEFFKILQKSQTTIINKLKEDRTKAHKIQLFFINMKIVLNNFSLSMKKINENRCQYGISTKKKKKRNRRTTRRSIRKTVNCPKKKISQKR